MLYLNHLDNTRGFGLFWSVTVTFYPLQRKYYFHYSMLLAWSNEVWTCRRFLFPSKFLFLQTDVYRWLYLGLLSWKTQCDHSMKSCPRPSWIKIDNSTENDYTFVTQKTIYYISNSKPCPISVFALNSILYKVPVICTIGCNWLDLDMKGVNEALPFSVDYCRLWRGHGRS